MFSKKHRKSADGASSSKSAGMGHKTKLHFDRVKNQMREYLDRGPAAANPGHFDDGQKGLDRGRTPVMPHKAFTPSLRPKHHDSSMAFRTPQPVRHVNHRH